MKKRALIIYSSVDGHTRKICECIEDILVSFGHRVDVVVIDDLPYSVEDLTVFDKLLIASSIRYGKHNDRIEKFIDDHADFLNVRKTAFISVNLVARKAEKNRPDTNPYVIKFLGAIQWKPTLSAVFAGKLNYKLYTLKDRILIKLIMLITKGPVRSKTEIDYTNWNEVAKFANELAAL